jgi:hypothetical protein
VDGRDSRASVSDDRWERICQQLTRIADALESFRPETSMEPEPPMCLHPPETRIDFGTTAGTPDWQCGICHYRTTAAS